jgi:predicted SprT family Zn-dependent metalloprotease
MTPIELRARCKEVVELAKTLYGIDMSQVQIGWCKGRVAGKAGGKRLRDTVMSNYFVKFNNDMLKREAAEHIDEDTVPHEYAHILGYINPERFGSKHDYLWAKTTRELGGSGDRCHNEAVVYGTGTTYEYTTDRGHKVRLSDKKHSYVRAGGTLRYKRGMGTVSIACAYSIVGHQGRTLTAPIVKKAVADLAPNAPAAIESFVRAPVAPVFPQYMIDRIKVVPVAKIVAPMAQQGLSKAAMARAVMLSGHTGGKSYEEIILAIMAATGHDRQLSRSYYKGNYQKVGVPAPI